MESQPQVPHRPYPIANQTSSVAYQPSRRPPRTGTKEIERVIRDLEVLTVV